MASPGIDDGLLRHNRGTDRSWTGSWLVTHPKLCRVGNGGFRTQHPGVYLHRPSNSADFRSLAKEDRGRYFLVTGLVLLTVIVVRPAWHMSFNAVLRWRNRRFGFHPPRPTLRPTIKTGLIISWAGMRGIVSLAAAMALPDTFPYRNLIVLTAFSVVLGTLVIQGLTLKPLLRALALRDDDPVSREVWAARERALQAALQSVAGDPSPAADAVRQNLTAHLTYDQANANEETTTRAARSQIYRNAIQAARRIVLAMRSNNEIGDDAFHRVEEELDWLEVGAGNSRQ